MTRTLIFLGILNCCAVALNVATGPRFELQGEDSESQLKFVPSNVLKVADAPVNVPAEFTCDVRNISRSDVLITNVSTSCGCTDFDISSRRIAAGETATLWGTVRGKPRPETASASITLTYETSGARDQKRMSELFLSVQFVSAISVVPESITVRPDEYSGVSGVGEFSITNETEKEVHYDVVAPDFIKVSPSEIRLGPNQSKNIDVFVGPDATRGNGTIRFRNRDSGEERTASVVISPQAGVYSRPRVLSLGIIRETGNGFASTNAAEVDLLGGGVKDARITVQKLPPVFAGSLVKTSEDTCSVQFSFSNSLDGLNRIHDVVELNVDFKGRKSRVIRIPVIGVVAHRDAEEER